jgi:hypothetical protein
MSVGLNTDFKIYSPQFWGGVIEVLQQNTDAFNESSANTLRLVTRDIKGFYEQESFLKRTTGLINRRNTDTQGSIDAQKLTHGEFVGVKVNRRIGPVEESRDAYKKIGLDAEQFSFQFGSQVGEEIAADYINSSIRVGRAAIKNQAALIYDATLDTLKTANHTALVSGMAKMGDKASRITAFVMHSKNYFDLVKQQLADKIFNVADVTVYAGTIASFGKPVIVIDSSDLLNLDASGNITSYDVLALTQDSVECAESEERDIISQDVTGQDNLTIRIQGEYAYNLRVKGCAWDITNGGKNPTDTALALKTNWLKQVADNKSMPGVVVTFQ